MTTREFLRSVVRESKSQTTLLVEDSILIRTTLRGILKRHNVIPAGDGKKAVAILER
jgi:hypothetical protein